MKKIIKMFLILVLLSNYGCINNQTKEEEKFKDEKKLFLEHKENLKERKTSCQDIVVIDIEEIENSKREQWLRDNENYKCNPEGVTNTADCNYEKQCSENLVTIDLQKIVDENNPSTENDDKKRAEWLQNNGPFICFRNTIPHITGRHIVSSNYIKLLMSVSKSYDLTFKEFKDKVNKAGGVGYYNADNYDNYLIISISGDKVVISLSKTFNTEYVCYSIPLFRSIEQSNCLKDEDVISFVPITINNKSTIAFKIKTANNSIYYYDYSDEPKSRNNFY
jgi:hypothetical protein